MQREVLIFIKGIDGNGDEDDIENIHGGLFYQKNGKVYIKYDYCTEDGSKIQSMIKISEKEVEMTNKGAVNSKMVFMLGQSMENSYESPYGVLDMEVKTRVIRVEEKMDSYNLELEYDIYFNGQYSNTRHVFVRVVEQGSKVGGIL